MKAIVRLRYAAKTDVGMKRAHNEDYFSLIEDEKVFIFADGMGGHACGEVASKLSGDVISEFYQHSKDMDATWPYRYDPALSYPENRMVAAVRLPRECSCFGCRRGVWVAVSVPPCYRWPHLCRTLDHTPPVRHAALLCLRAAR